MLPDVGAGAPFSLVWWLAVVVLVGCGMAVGVMMHRVNRAMDRREKSEEAQNQAIQGVLDELHQTKIRWTEELHQCQIHCAEHRGRSVQREEYEGRLMRFEDLIVRVHKRVDTLVQSLAAIAEKLGVVKNE